MTWLSCSTRPARTTWTVLQNTTTDSFNIITVANSVFTGTAVGVATGTLSTGGTYTTYQDIAVLYAAPPLPPPPAPPPPPTAIPPSESLVRVFQNKQSDFSSR